MKKEKKMLNFQCVFGTILYVLQNLSHLIL